MSMDDWRNSEISTGEVGESQRKVQYAPVPHEVPRDSPSLAPVCLTALYVVMVTPSVYIRTPVKVILDQVLPSSIWHWVKC